MRLKDYEIPGEENHQVHAYLDNQDSYVIFSYLGAEIVKRDITSNKNRFLARQVKLFIEKYHTEEKQDGNSKLEIAQPTYSW